MSKLVKICRLGRISYLDGIKLQKTLIDCHRYNTSSTVDTLLLLEHPPVYTIGIRTKGYTIDDEKRLLKTGAEFYKTNRGGLITFHGPGQLVVYPILNLKNFQASMRWYINQLECTIINLCKHFGLKAETSPYTGVWVRNNKICAIGVHGSRFITSHGLALNCNTDLAWYEHIVPCGIEGKGVTSLTKELGRCLCVDEAIPVFLKSFSNTFDCSFLNSEEDEVSEILSKIS
ncbi:hypothetical protein RN001_004319 [Aquatica leii]|uniref:Octanoyl-[acyl-carrier-protein]:protein N-octanoyltransferase LIPT2, mitochondrial n=1 Tax=Aquatica leii TaxID=1421715 RepID=A0AAN7Q5P4_9COLE|nr:hypothetical protein RN001_004319 [Aquatica leii]